MEGRKMYDGYIDEFMPSVEMREYLKTVELSPTQITDLIYFSQRPLTQKLKAMKELIEQAGQEDNRVLIKCAETCIKNMEEALKALDVDGVFSVEILHFDEGSLKNNGYFETICSSFDDVMSFAQKYTELTEYEPSDLIWYKVAKWVKDEKGRFETVCGYEIINGSVVNSELEYKAYKNKFYVIDSCNMTHINLPVPFKPGDIVEVDGFPYGPKYRMVIVEIGDNEDCCCLQGLAKNREGYWHVGAVKHGHVSYDTYPQFSPLYTIKTYTDDLMEDERVLYRVKEYIAGDDGKGRRFRECVLGSGDVTDEGVEKILLNLI